jgi:hypothetical protein
LQYFLFRLLPPRLTSTQDLTAEERAVMKSHGPYSRGKLSEGKIIAFGPVADPAGGWGVGILRVADPAEAGQLTAADPVILADKRFRHEVFSMPEAVHA